MGACLCVDQIKKGEQVEVYSGDRLEYKDFNIPDFDKSIKEEGVTSDGVYEGQWKGKMKHGYGVQSWPDGSKYEGKWANDVASGHTHTHIYMYICICVYRFWDFLLC
eukprot:GHVR01151030.1.p1 GENE.GHVR01151030.1~~GHVR01151030.1.p1  ORF type:complete len:107 (-),score=28.69 GHVR01151030.1:193-513(-)